MISKTDDRIDSREVIDRLKELSYAADNDFIEDDEKVELASLARLVLAGETLPDWNYGVQLIHENDFATYAKEFRQECDHQSFDAIPEIYKENLDWDGIAEDMRPDFTVIEWDGETFYTL